MATGRERRAAQARGEPTLRFTSVAHHLTRERVWEHLWQMPSDAAPGVDGQTVAEAKKDVEAWIEPMLQAVHRRGYQAPPVRRVSIPQPGKPAKRPLGVPGVADRALQRRAAHVLSALDAQDVLPCSVGGRPGLSAHQALATLTEAMAGRKVGGVLEADLKHFLGSVDHGGVRRVVAHRVGDARRRSLIRRWLKAGILDNGELRPNEEGTPQGGAISVLRSHVDLHDVLDLWCERVVKPRVQGEASWGRDLDDFVRCCQVRADALRGQEARRQRVGKVGLAVELVKTQLVECGRGAQRHASTRGRKRPETMAFLGFTLSCTQHQKGQFTVGLRTEKRRLQRRLAPLRDLIRRIRHLPVHDQVNNLNQVLRGHYAYYGIAGNFHAVPRGHRAVERYWYKMLCSRSRKGRISWEVFHRITARFPLQRPRLRLPYRALQAMAVL